MKRAYSDSEGDDGFGEDDCGSVKAGSPTQSCHSNTRKKRRGIIEKRRRDRINHSLSELRRLVPAAFEKQGSAKLEKAEILQMTVDHLKILSSKGLNSYNVDTAALALDYRSIGFRECMSEVSRYLVSVEGLDIQDPLRLRLGSHLQCYSTQRDVASKAAATLQHSHTASAGSWNISSNPGFNSQYNSTGSYNSLAPPPPPPPPPAPHSTGMISQSLTHHPSSSTSDPLSMSSQSVKLPTYTDSARLPQPLGGSAQVSSLPPLPSSGSTAPHVLGPNSSSSGGSQGSLTGLSQMASQFPGTLSSSTMPLLSPHYSSSSSSAFQQSSVRHHRPWGTDLAF